jgi:Protein of unknown function (DUF3562)
MTLHYKSEAERDLHRSQAAMLVRELGEPESLVITAYEQEVARLMTDARIREFIAVIAAKQVKDSFRRRSA